MWWILFVVRAEDVFIDRTTKANRPDIVIYEKGIIAIPDNADVVKDNEKISRYENLKKNVTRQCRTVFFIYRQAFSEYTILLLK